MADVLRATNRIPQNKCQTGVTWTAGEVHVEPGTACDSSTMQGYHKCSGRMLKRVNYLINNTAQLPSKAMANN